MIIDCILDRKGFEEDGVMDYYNPRDFYWSMMSYGSMDMGNGYDIARAMDGGTEEDVKRELCKYIDDNGYNPQIKDYINSVKWLSKMIDTPKYPEYIMKNVRQKMGLDADDVSMDKEIEQLTPGEVLNKYWEWFGIFGYTDDIINSVCDVFGYDKPSNDDRCFW